MKKCQVKRDQINYDRLILLLLLKHLHRNMPVAVVTLHITKNKFNRAFASSFSHSNNFLILKKIKYVGIYLDPEPFNQTFFNFRTSN